MEEKYKNFILLSKKYEHLNEELKNTREDLIKSMKSIGEGNYLQDLETMAVYKIVKPVGHYVFYKSFDYLRTSLGDEIRGTLSKKEAAENGFIVTK